MVLIDMYVAQRTLFEKIKADIHKSIVTLVFFITYTIFQPPGTIICRKIGPRVFLSCITLLWGCVMIGFGFVKDWNALVGLRAILGILEVRSSDPTRMGIYC